ncbi:MAG: SigE family RNA polymerase sigma factor [Nocardioides sp.]|nr:SigE family RNA polymerase sigma factor [Nocardioidaceae bacterium]MCB8956298.1 SigE family RNA polymerase sigma factor [Nocardioides sp.]
MGRTPAWEGAYREFFVARKRSLMRTAYAVLGSWPAAEDAVQTAFTQLYVHWPRIQPGAIDTYARRTVVHTCFRMARQRGRETATERLPDQPVAGPEGGVERLDLLEALAGLSARDRAVIALRFLDDLPVAEVARVLDLPEGTVKSRTSRALDRLQAVLTPPQPTEREHP